MRFEGHGECDACSASVADAFFLPRLVYYEDESSIFYGHIADGEALIKVEGREILNQDDLESALKRTR